MVIIGLVGTKGSGKSTVAQILKEELGFEEYSIAEPLKRIALILGAPRESVYGTQAQKEAIIPSLGVSGRTMLQKLGTEVFRNEFPKYLPTYNMGSAGTLWARLLELRLKRVKNSENLVVSDVRFSDEARVVEENGGTLIRLLRDTTESKDYHASEIEMRSIKCNHIIDNNGTMDELRKQILNYVNMELV